MSSAAEERVYDLEERPRLFAQAVRSFLRSFSGDYIHVEDARQLVRSSGSVGANYIEANECLGDADFLYRIKLCRKEAKESRYWLDLLLVPEPSPLSIERDRLAQEALELTNIFGAIYRNRLARQHEPSHH